MRPLGPYPQEEMYEPSQTPLKSDPSRNSIPGPMAGIRMTLSQLAQMDRGFQA